MQLIRGVDVAYDVQLIGSVDTLPSNKGTKASDNEEIDEIKLEIRDPDDAYDELFAVLHKGKVLIAAFIFYLSVQNFARNLKINLYYQHKNFEMSLISSSQCGI